MPKTYLIANVKKFHEEAYLKPIQQDLLDVEGEAEISIVPKYKNFYDSFDQYISHHDFKIKKFGKVRGRTFNYYFEPIDFYTYFSTQLNLAIISTKTKAALDFIKQLNSTGYYELEPVKIDFESMYPHITELSGAWVAKLKRTNLHTLAFFGPHVNKNEDFKMAANEGEIASVRLRFISSKSFEEHNIVISKKGSITLYDEFETIEDELDIVMEIYNKLIKPAEISAGR